MEVNYTLTKPIRADPILCSQPNFLWQQISASSKAPESSKVARNMSSDMASLGDSEKETSMLASGCQAAAPPANPQSNVETLTSGKVRASSSFRFLFNLQKIVEETQRTTTVLDISTCQAVQKVQTLVKHLSERRGMKNFPQPRAGKRVENFSSLKMLSIIIFSHRRPMLLFRIRISRLFLLFLSVSARKMCGSCASK